MQKFRVLFILVLLAFAALLFLNASDSEAARYLTTEDNENNAGTGTPDGDMPSESKPLTCVFKDSSVHPVEFTINVTGAVPAHDAYLSVLIGDVDLAQGEIDEVFLNGHSLGHAIGKSILYNSTLFIIPDLSWVLPGRNLVQVFVDRNDMGYCARVANGQLIIDEGNGAGPATIRTLTSNAPGYNFGGAATINVEVDTPMASQHVRLEFVLRDPNGNSIDYNLDPSALDWPITGNNDEPYQWNFNLPSSGASGLWSVTLTVYDVVTEEFNAMKTTYFSVPPGAAAPILSAVNPSNGPVGTGITITGQNFITGNTVCTLGGQTISNVVVLNAGTVTGNVPAGLAAGTYGLSCTTTYGTGNLPNAFTVTASGTAPTISSVTPASGPVGTGITIGGQNFITGNTSCTLGGQAVTNLTVVNASQITGNVPAGLSAGSYGLSCTTSFGTGNLPNAFTVTSSGAAPVLSSVNPSSGPVGTGITIGGQNFITGNTSCTLGGQTVTNLTVLNASQITGNVPAGLTPGTYGLSCTTTYGTGNLPNAFTVTASGTAPTISSVNPASGHVGTGITIGGQNFIIANTICTLGGETVTNLVVVNASTITGNVPVSLFPGTYGMSCTTAYGTGNLPNAFTVIASGVPPTIISVSPSSGLAGSGITITGREFVMGNTSCKLGGRDVSNLAVEDASTITGGVPAELGPGTYDLKCTTPYGKGKLSDAYTVLATPAQAAVIVPTLGEWGVVIFMCLAGLGAFYALKRRQV